MAKASASQFDVVSTSKIRHKPSGAEFYMAPDADPAPPSSWFPGDLDVRPEYSVDDVKAVALELLQELARRRG